MAQMVEEHRDNIPILAKGESQPSHPRSELTLHSIAGFQESRKYLPDAVITSFLNQAIRNRISLRLTAEQHLSLSAASLPSLNPSRPLPTKDPRIEPSARAPSLTSFTPDRKSVV